MILKGHSHLSTKCLKTHLLPQQNVAVSLQLTKPKKLRRQSIAKNAQRREHLLQNVEGVGQKVQQRRPRALLSLKRRVAKDVDVEGQRRRKKMKRTQLKMKLMKTKLEMIR
ncbi:unnamed protein product [Callosobruchus maculatus]|uniref:Uncharacterized protein n=1 Tax=Callosobruchus maculatus TaxID=64391 RepID=A0A653CD16_CALMS|nr:unnamed protein product [Callosobruchus maculatus]